jgi:pSer/pThr/pTyr-binding forkhead associated (FHA) protein
MHIILKLLDGEVIEKTLQESVVTIGRSPKCTIHVSHDAMSRNHCQIEVVDGEVFITDLNSTNGVFIDNEKIEPNQRVHYQTFLNLSFGAILNAQIKTEDPVVAPEETLPSKIETTLMDKTYSQSPTRTLARQERKEKKNSTPEAGTKQDKKEKYQLWMNNLIVFLILAFAAYYYLTQDIQKIDYSDIRQKETVELIPIPEN